MTNILKILEWKYVTFCLQEITSKKEQAEKVFRIPLETVACGSTCHIARCNALHPKDVAKDCFRLGNAAVSGMTTKKKQMKAQVTRENKDNNDMIFRPLSLLIFL